jgi:hypothetical protein
MPAPPQRAKFRHKIGRHQWPILSSKSCPFRKFYPAGIRLARQNHRMMTIDVCDPSFARNVHRRLFQAALAPSSGNPISSSSTRHRFKAGTDHHCSISSAQPETLRSLPHHDIELMAQIEILDLKPAPRLETVKNKNKQQMKQGKHRDGGCADSLLHCQPARMEFSEATMAGALESPVFLSLVEI